jgi:hypothetical protein
MSVGDRLVQFRLRQVMRGLVRCSYKVCQGFGR